MSQRHGARISDDVPKRVKLIPADPFYNRRTSHLFRRNVVKRGRG